MKTTLLTIVAAATMLSAAAQDNYTSAVWAPDRGDGTYQNPVLYADYSDPDACAVGDDYYLTASSFNCIPGLPILHSRDLVNWTIIGYALQELQPRDVFDRPQHGKGVWAPAIRHHDGRFYIYWGDPDYGIFMTSATDPAGRWSEPVCVVSGSGMIDPCPLWDDDGRCYLVNGWAASRAGFNSVLSVRELSADGTRAISTPRMVFDGGQQNHTTEGPKFYKRDGWYWILCPAGGVQMGWQLAMRARSPWGPYEWHRVLEQKDTDINGPHQGAWVHTAQGEDWFLHFNDKRAYGRVVFLQPVDWSSGWPLMGSLPQGGGVVAGKPYTIYNKPKTTAPVAKVNPQESDEFNEPTLGLQWQWQANYNQYFGQPTPYGYLRLYTYDVDHLWDAPNLLLQKLPAPSFTATAKLRLAAKADGQMGGVVMMGMDYEALVAERRDDGFVLELIHCQDADRGGRQSTTEIARLAPTERDTMDYSPAIYLDVYLRMTVADGQCRFAYSQDGRRFKTVGAAFTMRQGKWIGAKMGLLAVRHDPKGNRGWIDVDWFRVGR